MRRRSVNVAHVGLSEHDGRQLKIGMFGRGNEMSSQSTITVMIPTYNRSEWLHEAIETALAQSRRPDVVLVMDNGSTDDTPEMMRQFEDNAAVVYVRRATNIDPIVNENDGLKRVSTTYVSMVPDDDRIYPDFLRETAHVLDSNSAVGVVHTQFDLIEGGGKVVLPDIALVDSDSEVLESGQEFVRRHMADRWRVGIWLARTDALRSVGFLALQDRADWLMSDMLMWLEVALEWDYVFIPVSLGAIRVHEGTLTATRLGFRERGYATSAEMLDQYLELRRRFVDRRSEQLDDPAELSKLAERHWRLDRIDFVSQSTFPERRRRDVTSQLWDVFRKDKRTLLELSAWKLLATSLAGRQAVGRARRLLGRSHAASESSDAR